MGRGIVYYPSELEDRKKEIEEIVNKVISVIPICYGDPVLVTTENDDIKIKFFKKEEIKKDLIKMKITEYELMMMFI